MAHPRRIYQFYPEPMDQFEWEFNMKSDFIAFVWKLLDA